MAISRKRKHAAAEETSKQSPTVVPQKGMKAFASVSKPQNTDDGAKKRKTTHQRAATPPAVTFSAPTPAKAHMKRKRSLESVAEESDDSADERKSPGIFKQFAKPAKSATPRNKRFKNALPPSPARTPAKDAAALFDKLKINADTAAIPFALGNRPIGYETPPDTPDADKTAYDAPLPSELHDLCQLHAAFLTALSLHYAHNGTASAVDVKSLLPMITKNWKKRTVTLDDLRRVLAVHGHGQHAFMLEDYGRAGVCLSRGQPRGRALKRAASFVDEDELNGRFEEELLSRWVSWLASADKENLGAAIFINQLQLADIAKHTSTEKASPLFARGQQRLADLKAAQADASQAAEKPAPTVPTEQKSTSAIQSRGTSLLDRVLARQAVTASMPAGPTKQQLERKAALHRVEDIARVLDLLATKPRMSLSMPAMVQQLQQSLRNPISREEVERCLELMAKEVTPGFVNVVVSGAVKGVVVCRSAKIELEELRSRVEKACA